MLLYVFGPSKIVISYISKSLNTHFLCDNAVHLKYPTINNIQETKQTKIQNIYKKKGLKTDETKNEKEKKEQKTE